MNRSRFLLGLALTALAGSVDAVSFARFGAVYASFMSGNTVQIGLHIAGAEWVVLGSFLILVACFMGGGFLGGVALAKAGSWHVPLLLAFEAAALSGALWLDLHHGSPLLSTAPLSLAMGAQNQLVVLVRGANPGTTFVTGTAFRFGDAVAQRVLGRDPHGAWKLHLVVWLSFAVGAALGAWSQIRLRDLALAPLVGAILALTIVSLGARIVQAVRARMEARRTKTAAAATL